MSKKLSHDYVKAHFESAGWELDDIYTDSKTKLMCVCPKGHKQTKSWSTFSRGHDCKYCKNNVKFDIDYVRNYFADKGYKLVSKTYNNARTPIESICEKGHTCYISLDNFKSGSRCITCFTDRHRTEIYVVESYFKERHYELLSVKYINNHSNLKYKCDKGHVHNMSLSNFKKGQICPTCRNLLRSGSGHHNYKGGVSKLNIPLYGTYAHKLEKYYTVHKVDINNIEVLGVECTFCSKIFVPSIDNVVNRIGTINGTIKNHGDNNFYCSDNCKDACPLFNQVLWPKGFKPYKGNIRPDQKQWAKLVKERDSYTCQKCGAIESVMIAHHIKPVSQDPIESMDIDNGITLCESCDKLVHKIPGCSYTELRCN